METLINLFNQVDSILAAFTAVLVALIAFFMLIPGEQPEKALTQFKDFIAKFSRK